MKIIKKFLIKRFPQLSEERAEKIANMTARSIRTFCQSLAASLTVFIGEVAHVGEVRWGDIILTAFVAAIYSVITSFVLGTPDQEKEVVYVKPEEADDEEENDKEEEV